MEETGITQRTIGLLSCTGVAEYVGGLVMYHGSYLVDGEAELERYSRFESSAEGLI